MISQATSQLSPNHIKNLNEFKEFRDYITIFLPRVTDSILQTLIKGDIDTLNLYIAALLQMQHNEKLTQELDNKEKAIKTLENKLKYSEYLLYSRLSPDSSHHAFPEKSTGVSSVNTSSISVEGLSSKLGPQMYEQFLTKNKIFKYTNAPNVDRSIKEQAKQIPLNDNNSNQSNTSQGQDTMTVKPSVPTGPSSVSPPSLLRTTPPAPVNNPRSLSPPSSPSVTQTNIISLNKFFFGMTRSQQSFFSVPLTRLLIHYIKQDSNISFPKTSGPYFIEPLAQVRTPDYNRTMSFHDHAAVVRVIIPIRNTAAFFSADDHGVAALWEFMRPIEGRGDESKPFLVFRLGNGPPREIQLQPANTSRPQPGYMKPSPISATYMEALNLVLIGNAYGVMYILPMTRTDSSPASNYIINQSMQQPYSFSNAPQSVYTPSAFPQSSFTMNEDQNLDNLTRAQSLSIWLHKDCITDIDCQRNFDDAFYVNLASSSSSSIHPDNYSIHNYNISRLMSNSSQNVDSTFNSQISQSPKSSDPSSSDEQYNLTRFATASADGYVLVASFFFRPAVEYYIKQQLNELPKLPPPSGYSSQTAPAPPSSGDVQAQMFERYKEISNTSLELPHLATSETPEVVCVHPNKYIPLIQDCPNINSSSSTSSAEATGNNRANSSSSQAQSSSANNNFKQVRFHLMYPVKPLDQIINEDRLKPLQVSSSFTNNPSSDPDSAVKARISQMKLPSGIYTEGVSTKCSRGQLICIHKECVFKYPEAAETNRTWTYFNPGLICCDTYDNVNSSSSSSSQLHFDDWGPLPRRPTCIRFLPTSMFIDLEMSSSEDQSGLFFSRKVLPQDNIFAVGYSNGDLFLCCVELMEYSLIYRPHFEYNPSTSGLQLSQPSSSSSSYQLASSSASGFFLKEPQRIAGITRLEFSPVRNILLVGFSCSLIHALSFTPARKIQSQTTRIKESLLSQEINRDRYFIHPLLVHQSSFGIFPQKQVTASNLQLFLSLANTYLKDSSRSYPNQQDFSSYLKSIFRSNDLTAISQDQFNDTLLKYFDPKNELSSSSGKLYNSISNLDGDSSQFQYQSLVLPNPITTISISADSTHFLALNGTVHLSIFSLDSEIRGSTSELNSPRLDHSFTPNNTLHMRNSSQGFNNNLNSYPFSPQNTFSEPYKIQRASITIKTTHQVSFQEGVTAAAFHPTEPLCVTSGVDYSVKLFSPPRFSSQSSRQLGSVGSGTLRPNS